MLVWFTDWLTQFYSGFNVFSYLTFRAVLSSLTGLGISLLLGKSVIAYLQKLQIGQVVRNDGPETHFSKAGTPTMGGVLILAGILVSTLLWADLSNRYVLVMIFVVAVFGAIGWVDDFRKVVRKDPKGLIARWKYIWQSAAALAVAVFLYCSAHSANETVLVIPFFKNVLPQLGAMYLVLAYFVIVGTSNAVNLTDGLDGLAIMPIVMVVAALGFFAYLTGNVNFSEYLHIPYIPETSELVIVCAAVVGAGLGFLWFNTYPAQVFMGDVGSLALGAVIGTLAILVRQELVLFIMGGLFVMEALSVILQVGSYKTRQKRIFRMAPIHHHFELKGWPEPRVVVRFWIISLILVLIGLATLKLR